MTCTWNFWEKHTQKSTEHSMNFVSTASLPAWLEWGFWISPLAYAEIGVSVNEFHAPRWQKVIVKICIIKTIEPLVIRKLFLCFISHMHVSGFVFKYHYRPASPEKPRFRFRWPLLLDFHRSFVWILDALQHRIHLCTELLESLVTTSIYALG